MVRRVLWSRSLFGWRTKGMSNSVGEAEMKAREARRGLGMLDSEPLDISKLLRLVKGITIIRRPFEGDMSGYAEKVDH
jgi:hypothetical protein